MTVQVDRRVCTSSSPSSQHFGLPIRKMLAIAETPGEAPSVYKTKLASSRPLLFLAMSAHCACGIGRDLDACFPSHIQLVEY